MPARPRREFLIQGGRTALGLSLLPLAGCSPGRASEASDGQSGEQAPPALVAELERQIPGLLDAHHTPGLSIALVQNGRLAWSRGFGVKRAGAPAAVDHDTLFQAASISKTVFAYAVMKLAEKGILDLDTPLTTYLPVRWVGDPRFDRITTRHVLTHTTGLQNWRSPKEPIGFSFDPGTKWQYSGEAFSYLQLVVASLTGHVSTDVCDTMWDGLKVCATNVDAFMKMNLLRPFGMPSSGYVWETPSPHAAAGHDIAGTPRTVDATIAASIAAARYGAAGGLSMTAPEYARFLIEFIDPKPSDEFRLTRASRDAMMTPTNKIGPRDSYAMGWFIVHHEKGDLITHGGDNPGFKAFTIASIARRTGVIVLTNGDGGDQVIGALANADGPLNSPLMRFVTG